jgi:putative membrane protein
MTRIHFSKTQFSRNKLPIKNSWFSVFMVSLLILFVISCSGSDSSDSKEKADSTNTSRIDSARSQDTTSTHTDSMADLKTDAEFAVDAADGGMMEVALGKMAVAKAVSKEVKIFGKNMVTDHSQANSELKKLAAAKNISIPTELSEKCRKQVDELAQKKGRDFDEAYIDMMVKDHKTDIDEFKKESEKGKDPQLSEWAKAKIPTLEHHLMMAEEAQKNIEK